MEMEKATPTIQEPSVIAEHVKLRRCRKKVQTGENPDISSVMESTRSKSTVSSLLQSISNSTSKKTIHSNVNSTGKKKKTFTTAPIRGFGCTSDAFQKVCVPEVILKSADCQGGKPRKKKKKNGSKNNNRKKTVRGVVNGSNCNFVDIQDVWCGPGMGFYRDAVASVDCVVERRNGLSRGRIDAEKMSHREQRDMSRRTTVNPENISFLDSDTEISPERPGSGLCGTSRYCRHGRHPSSEGLAEIIMLRGSLLMGGILDSHDRFREWRLDVDNMSYEELLELGEQIGHVNTGLKEDEVWRCIVKAELPNPTDMSTHIVDRKCSICQEDYEAEDELGNLVCGHSYHMQCIRKWLAQKKFCPVCKGEVAVLR